MKTNRNAQPSRMTASDRIRLAAPLAPRATFPLSRFLKWVAVAVAVVVTATEIAKVAA